MTIPNTAIRNESGQVALKWTLNRVPKTIKIDGTDRYYVAVSKLNVHIYWVNEDDVERLLAYREKTCNCNNGTYVNALVYANEIDKNLHLCGNRHCD